MSTTAMRPGFEKATERQLEVYEFIRGYIQKRGFGPTVREIGTHFGFSKFTGSMCHLNALERKGLIRRDKTISRGISLMQNGDTCPCCGQPKEVAQ